MSEVQTWKSQKSKVKSWKELQKDSPLSFAQPPLNRSVSYGPTEGETAMRGFRQGATLESGDELAAMLQSGAISGPQFEKFLEEDRARTKLLENENPFSSFVSKTLGYAVPALSGGMLLRGAGKLGGLGLEALLGGLQGAGAAESMEEVPANMAVGGALGVGSVGLQKGVSSFAKPFRSGAKKAAYSATGGKKSDINNLYDNTPESIGRELLDKKIVRLGTSRGSEKMSREISDSLDEFGTSQSELMTRLDSSARNPFKTDDLITDLDKRAKEQYRTAGSGNRALGRSLENEADILKEVYSRGEGMGTRNLPMTEALELKRAFDKSSKFQSPMNEASGVAAAREARAVAKKQIDDTVERIAGPDVAMDYKKSRRSASNLMSAKEAVDESLKRDQGNLKLGLREGIAGSAGATVGASMGGGPMGALTGLVVGGALSKLSKTYGASTAAVLLDRSAKILASQGFEKGMRMLVTQHGQELARDIGDAIFESGMGNAENFSNPVEKSASFLLGPDVTKTVAADRFEPSRNRK